MTITDYMTNPAGRGSSILSSTEVKNSLNSQFEMIKDNIRCMWYLKNDRFAIVHVTIPSRKAQGVRYDVIIEFDLVSIGERDMTINNAIMKVYSNCPSFTYTYAYAFSKQNLLCDWLKSRYSNKVLTKEPLERNQYKIISFERSLYLACKFILSNDRNKLSQIKQKALAVSNYVQISTLVSTQEQIEERYQNSVRKQKEDTSKPTTSSSAPSSIKRVARDESKERSKISGSVKSTPISKSTKTTKMTKNTKTTKKI